MTKIESVWNIDENVSAINIRNVPLVISNMLLCFIKNVDRKFWAPEISRKTQFIYSRVYTWRAAAQSVKSGIALRMASNKDRRIHNAWAR